MPYQEFVEWREKERLRRRLARRQHTRRDDEEEKEAKPKGEKSEESGESDNDSTKTSTQSKTSISASQTLPPPPAQTTSASSISRGSVLPQASSTSTAVAIPTLSSSAPKSSSLQPTTLVTSTAAKASSVTTAIPVLSPTVTRASSSSTSSTSIHEPALTAPPTSVTNKDAAQQSNRPVIESTEGPSHTGLVFIGIGAAAAFGAIVFLLIMIAKRRRLAKASNPQIPPDARSNITRSIWGGGSSSASAYGAAPNIPPAPTMSPRTSFNNFIAAFMRKSRAGDGFNDKDGMINNASPMGQASNDAVDRQERLGRVRTDLLNNKDLNTSLGGSLMRSQSKAGQGFQGVGIPTTGLGLSPPPRRFPTVRERRGGEGVDILDIEAAGQFDDSVTVAARNSRVESVASMPRWRDPITWARDQARRNNSASR
ncbi:hypothetical protein BGZ60DRAFT_63623 [Tricladium varicosporioides]|nr:hypothetical protein BGZ60DRAFT_63623 [Hymenoscyphus varicosporioides]